MKSIKLQDDLFLVGYSKENKNIVMASFAAHLAMGNTILCKAIRSKTIEQYLLAVISLYRTHGYENPMLDSSTKRSSLINDIILEQKRWEEKPNRREPLTWPMIEYIQKSNTRNSTHKSSLQNAILDWFIIGMYTGQRLSEWAQEKGKILAKNRDGRPTAFIPSDINFLDKRGAFIDDPLRDTNNIYSVNVQWRSQKNGVNGEIITFSRNKNNSRCPVLAFLRVIQRSSDLLKSKAKSSPLSVYKNENCEVKYIRDTDIEFYLRLAAKNVYNIHKLDHLKKWSAHSIRVGACVALHEQGFSGIDIRHRLRWRSDTFLDYLRNTIKLAEKHSAAHENEV